MNFQQYIRSLISNGQLKKAISAFADAARDGDYENESIMLSAQFNQNERSKGMGVISDSSYNLTRNRITNALVEYMRDFVPRDGVVVPDVKDQVPVADNKDNNEQPIVFISYRHANELAALKVKKYLEENDITVWIDKEQMNAGENIKSFIVRMIKGANITLGIVSEQSLKSPWVGLEGDYGMMIELLGNSNQKYITCSLDQRFFDPEFTTECMVDIKSKIDKLNASRAKRLSLITNADTSDLDIEISRTTEYLHNIPKLIGRLKETLTVDISDNKFEGGMNRIISTINTVVS